MVAICARKLSWLRYIAKTLFSLESHWLYHKYVTTGPVTLRHRHQPFLLNSAPNTDNLLQQFG